MTYEYKCRKCGKHFEVKQKITDDALTKCPALECGGEVYRLISGSPTKGFVCKGSGWYRDGY